MKRKAFRPIHFFVVFNPVLNRSLHPDWTQAHEFYHVLKKNIEYGVSDHLYWGKISITQNKHPLNMDLFHKAMLKNQEAGRSTHLFISDFNCVWVGKVEGIENQLEDKTLTLSFYKDKSVEIWFKVTDMTLQAHNYLETYHCLSQFKVDHELARSRIKHFTPYMDNLRYPLLIVDQQDKDIFGKSEGKLILQNPLHVLEKGTGKTFNQQNCYTIPNVLFSRMPRPARSEILESELKILESKDLVPLNVARSYVHALELTLSDLFLWHLKKNLGDIDNIYVQQVQQDGGSSLSFLRLSRDQKEQLPENYIKLQDVNYTFPLKSLLPQFSKSFTGAEIDLLDCFKDKLDFWNFVKGTILDLAEKHHFLQILGQTEEGNPLKINLAEAMKIRNLILGVGSLGIINQLIASYYQYEVGNIFFHKDQAQTPDNQATQDQDGPRSLDKAI